MGDEKPVIALLTDFGTRDYFVAAMKGRILSVDMDARIVDITHDIPPQNIGEAAFSLRACYRDFPLGTIFVVVVDPGVGSGRRALAAKAEGYYFIAPDNGILSFVLDGTDAHEITNKDLMVPIVSNTFHGRDVFAPAAAYLSIGRKLTDLGPNVSHPVIIPESAPLKTAEGLTGEVIHVDRFGNLITNLTLDLLPADFEVNVGGSRINTLKSFYAEAAPGELFMIAGSAGFMEICIREASAASALTVSAGERIFVREHPDKGYANA